MDGLTFSPSFLYSISITIFIFINEYYKIYFAFIFCIYILNNPKGSLALIGDGIRHINILFEKKSFWLAYLLCLGFFDVFSALYATTYPNKILSQVKLDIYIGGNLLIFLGVFTLLIITGKEKVFGTRSFANLWRVWSTQFVAGLWILLGTLCFIIPGLLLAIKYIYSAEVALLEESRIGQSLRRSSKLSSFNGGKVVLSCFIIFILFMLFIFIMAFIIGLISMATLDSFAMNYFIAVTGTLSSTLLCTIVYSGYIDALSFESSNQLKASES